MKVKVVAKHFMIRNGIEKIIQECFDTSNKNIDQLEQVSDISENEKKEIDYILLNLTNSNAHELECIDEIKKQNTEMKVLVIDLESNEKLLLKAMQYSIDGYICNILNKDDFKYVVTSIYFGKKYYEGELMRNILSKSVLNKKRETLTKREKDIMVQIGNGLTNKEISNELYVTEYTVKKHITSIFSKLNIKNRSEAIVYLQRNLAYI